LLLEQAKQVAVQAKDVRVAVINISVKRGFAPDEAINLTQLKAELKKLRRLAQSLETKTRHF
jgi:hypothetical protein